MSVTDYLDVSQGRPRHKAGRSDLIRVLEGTDEALVEFAPRLDFGRVATRLRPHEQGLEVSGTIGPKVSVDVMIDDSIVNDEEKRMRIDVRA